jgi:mono/diheme cytochrome c family protein
MIGVTDSAHAAPAVAKPQGTRTLGAAHGVPSVANRQEKWMFAVVRTTAVVALLLLAGCERTMRDMYDQPRYKPLARSALWPDGRASRPPVVGTVARSEGTFAGTTSGRLGVIEPAPEPRPLDTVRDALRPQGTIQAGKDISLPPITVDLLAHGRERFDIFCAPCHSIAGDGDGMIARRGFPHPPSFHTDRLREVSDAHIYAVITEGYGAMHSYATRVPPSDRLAIVAYIRVLQWSQHAPSAGLDGFDVAQLDAAGKRDASPSTQDPPAKATR